MKIMIISNAFPFESQPLNGIFEYDQAKALSKIGHDVIFVALDLRSIRRKRKLGIQHFFSDGMPVYSIAVPVGAVFDSLFYFLGRIALKRVFSKVKKDFGLPDIIHAHFYDMGIIASTLSKDAGIPLVITFHSSLWLTSSISNRTVNRIKFAIKQSSAVIAVSSALSIVIQNLTGYYPLVIPNVVDLDSCFSPSVFPNRRKYTFVSAGNLLYGKGFDLVIKAFSKLNSRGYEAQLIIMGGGEEESNLKSQAKHLCCEKSVVFTGRYDRQSFFDTLSKSDCFVLASRAETFGVVYIEALSKGIPVIATRCGGPDDIVDDTNGLLVNVDDVDALYAAMEWMINNSKEKYNNMQISRCAIERYSPTVIAERLTKVYNNITQQSNI